MRPFSYAAPTSVEAAIALLADHGDRARPLAGGTDLLVRLRQGCYDIDLVVDVKRIPELTQVTYDPELGLTVGAAVTCMTLSEAAQVRKLYPGLIDAVAIIGGVAIRERATLGGNLCNAAPSADSIPAMMVLGAKAEVAGPAGRRRVAVADFCTAPGQTILEPGELVTSFHFPPPKPDAGACYVRFTPRGEMDIAVAGAGAWVALDSAQTITAVRIALSAVGPKPLEALEAGTALVGQAPMEATFAKAAALAQSAAAPIDDTRGTAAQRHHLVGVLVKRALRGAVARAVDNDGGEG
jgi:CO/xanthine dehydrogenase FAD-binding subunit